MPVSQSLTAILALSAVPVLLWATNLSLESAALHSLTLIAIGAILGAALNYFHFGFSSSFRSLLLERRTAGMRAILWMLGVAILLFAPLLALEHWQGQTFHGYIRTLSLAIPIGAFVFGIGMQIGCGCTSGTLNRVGQLQPLSFTTLFFMVIGGTLAAYTYSDWRALPQVEPFAFQATFGWLGGVVLQLVLLTLLYQWLVHTEKRRHNGVERLWHPPSKKQLAHPFLLAALGLALFNAFLLLASGSPWSISSIFPYWGTRLIDAFHLPIDWAFWDYAMENTTHLSQGPLENTVSLTTMGVILGALAVSLAHPRKKVAIRLRALTGSVIGGTLMGFGAVMASGCNIGAFFSGIASGSGHGWVWMIFAMMGNAIGLYLRGHFQKH